MLRWVARVLRIGLFALGLLMLLWLPISLFWEVSFQSPKPAESTVITVRNGGLGIDVWKVQMVSAFRTVIVWSGRGREPITFGWRWLLPVVASDQYGTYVTIPLWLLGAVCLAWPVTSFLLHRRRHKRGFPVEPKASESGAPKVHP